MVSVALLAGGNSSEREISIRSAENIFQLLKKCGYQVEYFDPASIDFHPQDLKKFDLVYSVLHGAQGEDGVIQGLLEFLGVPYVGSGVLASALTMNKQKTKEIWHHIGISYPKGFIVSSDKEENFRMIENLGYPAILKPISGGSSVGIKILLNSLEAKTILEVPHPDCIIEEMILGREMCAGVIEDESGYPHILPISEIRPKDQFYSFKAKYTKGMTEYILPAELPENTLKQINSDLIKMFRHFNLRDCIRVDFILTDKGPVYLEINTLPGMTETSNIPMMILEDNSTMMAFLDQTIKNVLERFRQL